MAAVVVSACVDQEFRRYFRCPDAFAEFAVDRDASSGDAGYFRFGHDLLCYGRAGGKTQPAPECELRDLLAHKQNAPCVLPFDPHEVATNLRFERYAHSDKPSFSKRAIRQMYYLARPALSVRVRRHLQRRWLKGWTARPFPQWPVDTTVDRLFAQLMRLKLEASSEPSIPFIWFWPENKQSCAIMTHDVETDVGLAFSSNLMDINDAYGIKSSFQLIPDARYTVTPETINTIRERGFEVNVHDLKHDGHLFDDPERFRESAARINDFGQRFQSKGFRSGALYRNQEWYAALNFCYDMSVPNCAHLDPQRGGCCTVMPYFIGNLLELPVTATQDYSLFHVLESYSLELWREQIERIMQHNGLISFIVHPDYLDTAEAMHTYTELLGYLSTLRDGASLWIALPGDVNTWWRQRDAMELTRGHNGAWRVVGAGAERARVAYASLQGGELIYTLSQEQPTSI